jgi:hypothetical protein
LCSESDLLNSFTFSDEFNHDGGERDLLLTRINSLERALVKSQFDSQAAFDAHHKEILELRKNEAIRDKALEDIKSIFHL